MHLGWDGCYRAAIELWRRVELESGPEKRRAGSAPLAQKRNRNSNHFLGRASAAGVPSRDAPQPFAQDSAGSAGLLFHGDRQLIACRSDRASSLGHRRLRELSGNEPERLGSRRIIEEPEIGGPNEARCQQGKAHSSEKPEPK